MDEHNAAVNRAFASGEITPARYGIDAETPISVVHRVQWLMRGIQAAIESFGNITFSQCTSAEIARGVIPESITFVCSDAPITDKFIRNLLKQFPLHTVGVERELKYDCVIVSHAGRDEYSMRFYIVQDANISSGRAIHAEVATVRALEKK